MYILFGTTSRKYCSNVYKINIKTLESILLFDSLELIETANYTSYLTLQTEYPDDFLVGRYRQEVVLYKFKIYVFGGGKFDGDSFSFFQVSKFK